MLKACERFLPNKLNLPVSCCRTLVSPYDLGRFDAMVSAREKEALDYLSMCVPGELNKVHLLTFLCVFWRT